MAIKTEHLPAVKLLEDRLFSIPPYQRAYSWKARQRSDLFNDIEMAHSSQSEHFMGVVVALAKDAPVSIPPNEFQEVELVDGQQRVTTITTLLKAVELALPEGDEHSERLRRLLVKSDQHTLVLLQTNQESSRIFSEYLRGGTLNEDLVRTAADRNLVDSIKECQAFVTQWSSRRDIVSLLAVIYNKLSVVYHQLDDEATVYRVFEVLNSRGLDVQWIDKTKSQLMAAIFDLTAGPTRAKALQEMQVVWKEIYEIFGQREGLEQDVLQFSGTLLRSGGLNRSRISSEELASHDIVQRAGNKLQDIMFVAKFLRSVASQVVSLAQDSRRAAVRKIGHANFVAIAILLRKFPASTKVELMAAWEKATFRIYGLGGADARELVGDYSRLGYDLFVKQLTPQEILARMKSLGADMYNKDSFTSTGFWDDCYSQWSEELRYLLYRYEEYLAHEAGEEISEIVWQRIWGSEAAKSIEHIAPQNSGRSYMHHLGNLLILPPGMNSMLQDNPPKEKAGHYKQSGLRQAAAVGRLIDRNKGRWTKKHVKTRAKRIEQFVRREWG